MNVLLVITMIVHILAIMVYLGGTFFMDLLLVPALNRIPPAQAAIVSQQTGEIFAVTAWIALGLIAASGLTFLYLSGSLGLDLFLHPYGWLIGAKTFLFLLHQIGLEGLKGQRASNIVMTSGTLNFPTFASLAPYEFDFGSVRCVMRELWMQGIRPGMKVLVLLPGWHYLSLLESRALTRLGAHCIMPFGTHLPGHADRFIATAAAALPDYILAFAPMMNALIDACYVAGRRPKDVFSTVRYVSVVGEPLTPGMRARLQSELELADVFERGGSSDGLWGGGECEYHRGHHVYADYFLIEIVDPDSGAQVPPGEMGSIVVTNLSLGKSTYLRFDCEDWGTIVPGPCPCGRTHPVIELHDRLANTLTICGRRITSQQVRYLLDEIPVLVGRPFLIKRMPHNSSKLFLHLARVPGREERDLAVQIECKCRQQLGVPLALTWHDRMPDGWKERIVDTSRVGEGLWARG